MSVPQVYQMYLYQKLLTKSWSVLTSIHHLWLSFFEVLSHWADPSWSFDPLSAQKSTAIATVVCECLFRLSPVHWTLPYFRCRPLTPALVLLVLAHHCRRWTVVSRHCVGWRRHLKWNRSGHCEPVETWGADPCATSVAANHPLNQETSWKRRRLFYGHDNRGTSARFAAKQLNHYACSIHLKLDL